MVPKPIRIIGIGNPLMGDDGIGIAAAERLAATPLPEGVEVIDGGTGGLTLLDLMEGAKKVLLVDAVKMGKVPGTILRLDLEKMESNGEGVRFSLHETGFQAVFALGREMGMLPPEIALFGVEPETVERRLGLSPVVAAALEGLVEQVSAEAWSEPDRR